MTNPEIGKIYFVKHSSGMIQAKFIRLAVYNPTFNPNRLRQYRTTTHFIFLNLHTGREIEIKSRAKIRREVHSEEYTNHLIDLVQKY